MLPLTTLRWVSGRPPDQPIRVSASLQRWEHLTFLHWRYDPAAVQALVPPGLRVQEWDGATWVGITPFRMAGVRAPGLPPPPGWSGFPELNVRIYVQGPHGRDGIWFPCMAVPRVSFLVAMRAAGLPHVRSSSAVSIVDARWSYRFDPPRRFRAAGAERFSAVVHVGDELPGHERTPTVDSITGRWSGYHRRAGLLLRTPIAHEPWPLHTATAEGELAAVVVRPSRAGRTGAGPRRPGRPRRARTATAGALVTRTLEGDRCPYLGKARSHV